MPRTEGREERIASSTRDVPHEPVGLLESVDARLGARTAIGVALRWLILVPMLAGTAALVVTPIVGVVIAATVHGTPPVVDAFVLFGVAVAPATLAIAFCVVERWALGRASGWGPAVMRLASGLPSSAGRARASFPFVSGLRFRAWRAAYLLFPADRLVLVSRGWHGGVVVGAGIWSAFAVIALNAMAGLDGESLRMGHMMLLTSAPIVVTILGRRVEVHEIPYDDLARVVPRPKWFELHVGGTLLGRQVWFRPFASERDRFAVLLRAHRPDLLWDGESGEPSPPDAAAGGFLAHVQQRLQDE
jgi:hypothetical protein